MRRLVIAGFAGLLVAGCGRPAKTVDEGSGLSDMLPRYLTRIAAEQWRRRAAAVSAIQTAEQVAERQTQVRPRLAAALGGFPEVKTPLRAKVTGTLARKGYRIEKVVFESLPGFYVTANAYVPEGRPPYPAVLIAAGHGWGGKALSSSQQVGASLALKGILGLAYDPVGQGERQEYFDAEQGKSLAGRGPTNEHMLADWQCRLTGSGYARYEIWDGVRAVDYLIERGDVDAKRIGVTGNSGGGTQAAYLAAVEPRLAAVNSVCYMTNWETLWTGPGPQDAEQSPTGFVAAGLDFGDLVMAYAPRPFLMTAGKLDYFPVEGARATAAETGRLYRILGKPEAFRLVESEGPHGYLKSRREETYRFMQKWLNGKEDGWTEPDVAVEADETLWATATGQVATSLRGATVQRLNREAAERLHAARKLAAAGVEEGRKVIAQRLGIDVSKPRAAPAGTRRSEERREGYRMETVRFESEAGITVAAVVLTPEKGPARKPAVLFLNPGGKTAGMNAGDGREEWHRWDAESLARAGYVVMAADLRGWGESAPKHNMNPGSSGYSIEYQTAARALLVGKTMAGMQTWDALRAFDYLASRELVDPQRIAIFGKGDGGVIALYAAALEPRVAKVLAEGALVSYLSVARERFHERLERILAPGVLSDFDLPDVAAWIAPRPVWIASPVRPNQTAARLEDVEREYAVARQAFERARRPGHFRMMQRLQGVTLEKNYNAWLREAMQ